MIYLTCTNCGWKTSSFLKYVELYKPVEEMGHEVEAYDSYCVHEGYTFLDLAQQKYFVEKWVGRDEFGCCGYINSNKPNLACENCNWLIARMVSDCCGGNFIKVLPNKTVLKEVPTQYEQKLYELDIVRKIDAQALNELLVLAEYQHKAFRKRIKTI